MTRVEDVRLTWADTVRSLCGIVRSGDLSRSSLGDLVCPIFLI